MGSRESLYKGAERLIVLVDEVREGATLTTSNLMARFSIKKAAALRYKHFVAEYLGARAKTRGGRKVVQQTFGESALVRAAAVEIALSAVGWLKGTSYHRELMSIARELRGSLSVENHDDLDRLVGSFYVKRREAPQGKQYAKLVDTLAAAIRERRRCRLEYTKLDGSRNWYEIEPWFLALVHDVLFVRAGKQPGGDARTFEIGNIHKMELLDAKFVSPASSQRDAHGTFRQTVGTYSSDWGEVEEVTLRVRDSARAVLHRRPLHTTQHMEQASADGWSTVRLKVVVCPELISAVLGLLPHVRVESPSGLRSAVRHAALVVEGSDWDP